MTKAKIAYFSFRNAIDMLNIYLQSECIEKYQFELCSKYDRKYGFDVILGKVVLCRKLRWICRKHSNDVARQVETPSKICLATNLSCIAT